MILPILAGFRGERLVAEDDQACGILFLGRSGEIKTS